jgi:hypothetical protein
MPAYNWEWRIFDPSTGRDELYLRLPSYPLLIRWDPSFASVEFLLRDRIVRTEWMFGSRIQDQVGLPADSCLCDFWFADDTWHVVTQEEVPTVWPDGRAAVAQLGKRWDLEASTRAWHVAAVDSQAGGHYGECFVTRQLERGAPRPAAIRMQSFVDSMSLGTGRVRHLSDDTHGAKDADEWIWLPSEADTTVGLELAAGEGDSYHAFEPVEWVDRRHGHRRAVYPIGINSKFGSQLGLRERRGLVLMTSEYDGAHPRLIDLRTGKILLQIDRTSGGGVWLPISPHR